MVEIFWKSLRSLVVGRGSEHQIFMFLLCEKRCFNSINTIRLRDSRLLNDIAKIHSEIINFYASLLLSESCQIHDQLFPCIHKLVLEEDNKTSTTVPILKEVERLYFVSRGRAQGQDGFFSALCLFFVSLSFFLLHFLNQNVGSCERSSLSCQGIYAWLSSTSILSIFNVMISKNKHPTEFDNFQLKSLCSIE